MDHKANIAAMRLREFDPKNACDTRRTVGFLGECSCGWHGSTRNSYSAARDDVRDHLHPDGGLKPVGGQV